MGKVKQPNRHGIRVTEGEARGRGQTKISEKLKTEHSEIWWTLYIHRFRESSEPQDRLHTENQAERHYHQIAQNAARSILKSSQRKKYICISSREESTDDGKFPVGNNEGGYSGAKSLECWKQDTLSQNGSRLSKHTMGVPGREESGRGRKDVWGHASSFFNKTPLGGYKPFVSFQNSEKAGIDNFCHFSYCVYREASFGISLLLWRKKATSFLRCLPEIWFC